ncbi:signal peptidase I [Sporanaerobium hydrogeniformans]|uniref:Signal peptidase I n=2 Tax=Sporanaerobium hydrogeniformans TaxID=3072179 RepID=A0AC61DCY3_9FIRM|nr:signal peptidase I [Sporanaerobium hydrogeniformans]
MLSCFIISHTHVPTGSMIPNIYPGEHLIVNRMPYYYRDPKPGEIVVFKLGGENLIKRVIAVPGDIIMIQEGKVYINAVPLDEVDYVESEESTYLFSDSPLTFPYKVPEGYYFMMGDNRKNSKDSRYFGAIPRERIFAKAGFCIYPFERVGLVR